MQGNKRLPVFWLYFHNYFYIFVFKKYWKRQLWKFLEIATKTVTLDASFSKAIVIQFTIKLEFTQDICLEFTKIFQNTSALLRGILVFGNVNLKENVRNFQKLK